MQAQSRQATSLGLCAVTELWQSPRRENVCRDLLAKLVTPERELLTIITGDGVSANMTDELVAHVGQVHPHISCEVHFGGQPLYPYLFGVE